MGRIPSPHEAACSCSSRWAGLGGLRVCQRDPRCRSSGRHHCLSPPLLQGPLGLGSHSGPGFCGCLNSSPGRAEVHNFLGVCRDGQGGRWEKRSPLRATGCWARLGSNLLGCPGTFPISLGEPHGTGAGSLDLGPTHDPVGDQGAFWREGTERHRVRASYQTWMQNSLFKTSGQFCMAQAQGLPCLCTLTPPAEGASPA